MDAFETPGTAIRRFTVLDGMILIGSLAVGLAAPRWFYPDDDWWELITSVVTDFAWSVNLFDQVVSDLMVFAMPSALALTLGVLTLRLRKPRPRWRRLARQPGVVASLVLVLSWVVAGAFSVANVFWSGSISVVAATGAPIQPGPSKWLESFTFFGSTLGSFAVVIAWTTQLLVGRWRAEPTWPDRLGRLVGVGWILMGLAGAVVLRSIIF